MSVSKKRSEKKKDSRDRTPASASELPPSKKQKAPESIAGTLPLGATYWTVLPDPQLRRTESAPLTPPRASRAEVDDQATIFDMMGMSDVAGQDPDQSGSVSNVVVDAEDSPPRPASAPAGASAPTVIEIDRAGRREKAEPGRTNGGGNTNTCSGRSCGNFTTPSNGRRDAGGSTSGG